jgi:hypothetical protein
MFVSFPPVIEYGEEVELSAEVLVYFIVFVVPPFKLYHLTRERIFNQERFFLHPLPP